MENKPLKIFIGFSLVLFPWKINHYKYLWVIPWYSFRKSFDEENQRETG